jgi:hypothetical protein
MSASNKLRSGTSRVDARLLLEMLDHISRHGGVATPEICELLALSRATATRMIANARDQYGVIITWRRDNSMPSHGEYSVEDWGVFDQTKVAAFFRGKSAKVRTTAKPASKNTQNHAHQGR